jgi:predicted AAA+ superfamily ATPase
MYEKESIEQYSRIVHEYEDGRQVKLTINTFNGKEYLHLREYYLNFDGDSLPSSKGISVPLDLANSYELFTGLVEILSLAESRSKIMEYFSDMFEELYQS